MHAGGSMNSGALGQNRVGANRSIIAAPFLYLDGKTQGVACYAAVYIVKAFAPEVDRIIWLEQTGNFA